MVAILAAACTVMGVIVGFSLGMVAGSRAAHTGHCAAGPTPALAASPAVVAEAPAAEPKVPGFLGIQFVTYDNGGALVTEVFSGTVADRLGFRAGDIITAVDERTIRNSQSLVRAIWKHKVGDTVAVTFIRDGVRDVKVATLSTVPREHAWRFKRWERARRLD